MAGPSVGDADVVSSDKDSSNEIKKDISIVKEADSIFGILFSEKINEEKNK